MANKNAEVLSADEDSKAEPKAESETLGAFLVSARERRGVSFADALAETRIPDHYMKMMESNDYSMISDQLYVLPFLRRYATFLQLDPEDVTMRFVREVQRADNAPSPRALEPIQMDRPRRRNWRTPALAAGLIATLAAAWIFQTHYRHAVDSAPGVHAPADQKAAAQ